MVSPVAIRTGPAPLFRELVRNESITESRPESPVPASRSICVNPHAPAPLSGRAQRHSAAVLGTTHQFVFCSAAQQNAEHKSRAWNKSSSLNGPLAHKPLRRNDLPFASRHWQSAPRGAWNIFSLLNPLRETIALLDHNEFFFRCDKDLAPFPVRPGRNVPRISDSFACSPSRLQ
jgi:hypothetical protein